MGVDIVDTPADAAMHYSGELHRSQEVAWPADGNHPFVSAGHAALAFLSITQLYIFQYTFNILVVNIFFTFCTQNVFKPFMLSIKS